MRARLQRSQGVAARLRRDARGVVLLAALLSVALLTLIVVEMTDATLVASHLNRNAGNGIAAELLARSAAVAAEGVLVQYRREEPGKTSLAQAWSVPFPDLPVGDGSAGFLISDEQGKLDLNQIGEATGLQRQALTNLFTELGLDPALLESVAVWIQRDPSGAASPDAASRCALPIDCEPRGGPLRSLDELALIDGFDVAAIERLRPFVTAFASDRPGKLGANINTARGEVLRALECSVGSDYAPPLEGYETTDDIEECDGVDRKLLHLDSDVFSIQARGTVGDTTETLWAIVDRRSSPPRRLAWKERPVFAAAPIGLP